MRLAHWVRAVATAGLVAAADVGAQVPSTDIWLADLSVTERSVSVGRGTNVTRRSGYDNQPCFVPDGSAFLFTAGDSVGTDVFRWHVASARLTRVTATAESEYSPTPYGDPMTGFCAVRVESDSTQRLWRFDADGSNPRPVMSAVDSVGYFAWVNDATLVAFIVGEPHTLRRIDVASQREQVVARDIGRAIHCIPESMDVSFTMRGAGETYTFFVLPYADPRPVRLIDAPAGGQDAAWVGRTLLATAGSVLYAVRPFDAGAWERVADLTAWGMTGATRLAVSPDGTRMAVVGTE